MRFGGFYFLEKKMEPLDKQQFSLTASVTWQNGVLLRMATALSRKGFDVVFFRKIGRHRNCDMAMVIEGPAQHLPHALVVLEQLIDVAQISLRENECVNNNAKNHRQKVPSVAQ